MTAEVGLIREQIKHCRHSAGPSERVQIGPGVGIERGCLHEWFGVAGEGDAGLDAPRRRFWLPPVAVLLGLVSRLAAEGGVVVWVGRRCWPLLQPLMRTGSTGRGSSTELHRRCLFLDPASRQDRVWAIDLAVRSPAVAAVVADGSGVTMAESRRVQLAASSGGACALLVRPPWEVGELSTARTRWSVSPQRSAGNEQAWTVELLRCKGVQPEGSARRWTVRRDHATGTIGEWAAARDRPSGDVGVAADGFDRLLPQAGIA